MRHDHESFGQAFKANGICLCAHGQIVVLMVICAVVYALVVLVLGVGMDSEAYMCIVI
jgi:hypothetical protein